MADLPFYFSLLLCNNVTFVCRLSISSGLSADFSELTLVMPDKHKSRSKSSSVEATKGYEDVEFVSHNVILELFQSRQRLLKTFVMFVSIAASLTKRVDVLVVKVVDLKASLLQSERYW